MKTAAIIAEYNPFHNGHRYQIEQTRKKTGADFILVLMSGNFVQRGGPAVIDKYTRTRMALDGGADAVFELPVCFAGASAEYFAGGAVMLLDLCGCVDFLSFGVESGSPELFLQLSSLLIDEPESFQSCLKQELQNGATFPAARSKALLSELMKTDYSSLTGTNALASDSESLEFLKAFLSSPNNILGIEYIKSLLKQNSSIVPIFIHRAGAGYHSFDFSNTFCSATALRSYYETLAVRQNELKQNSGMAEIKKYLQNHCSRLVPETTLSLLAEAFQKTAPITAEDFALPLRTLCLTSPVSYLSDILDIGSELALRIASLSIVPGTLEDFVRTIKTKQVTHTRILRSLFHLLLGIRQEEIQSFLQNNGYLRLLGFRSKAAPLLKQIKKKSQIPLLTKPAAAEKLFSKVSVSQPNPAVSDHEKPEFKTIAKRMFELDVLAARLYHQVIFSRYGTVSVDEYQHSPIIIET